ncbi:PAS domain-containing sensor histidine kinase [Chryseosolibacter indicus]|uniref:histidine kinase n=1 Tax=Chryseosolibacter indicus TaxID=2782351 RepID=A0ABS5VUS7_9BACT|nr:PAS domain S-box protein [Chryseosolibacter indicus]MBT1704509.1 PAS domain S-box protein [Chryseosolibacter indicus]
MHGISPSYSTSPEERIERLNYALNAAEIGTWNFYPIENLVEWDERCRELYGFPPEKQISYEQVIEYIHADDREKVRIAVVKALEVSSGGLYDVQFRTTGAKDKRLRWLHCKGKAYFNNEGVPYRLSGIAQDITSTVIEKERSALSEKIAQVALENTNSGYFLTYLGTDIIELSPASARIFTGTPRSDLKRTDLVNRIHPDDIPIRAKAYEEAEKTGRLHYEARAIWDDGSVHWFRALGAYLNDASGKPYLLTGTLFDITIEHQRRKALEDVEDLLAIAFNSAFIGMAFCDQEGSFLKVNAAYAQLLGYSEQELSGLNFNDITHPDDRSRSNEVFQELVSGKRQSLNLIKRYVQKDGAIRWVQINVTPIKSEAYTELRLLAIVNDISAEMQNERALAESQAMFKNVANSAPTGLWLSDESGSLSYVNETLIEWSGVPYDSLLNKGWLDVIIEEDRENSYKVFSDAVTRREHYDVMFRMRKVNGEVIWCRAAGDPYYNSDGSYAGHAGYCMDINELITVTNKIKAGEAQFRNMIEQAPMAISLLTGRDMIIEVGNDKIFEIWGKEPSITGKKLVDALPEIKEQGFIELLEQVYDNGKPIFGNGTLAKLMRKGKLEEAYFDFTYTPMRDGEKVTGVMVMATEVTQQVNARKALEISEARFRSLIEEAPFATALYVGRDLIIETANDEMIKVWGKDSSVIGMRLEDALPELEGQPFLQILDNVYTTGEAYHATGEKVDLVVNGKLDTFYFNFTYKPLRDKQGHVYAILNMAVNVTEQVISRQKLEESELFSRSIIENSPVAKLVLVGEEMVITTVNKNMLQMLGREASVIGKNFFDVLPELATTPLAEHLSNVYKTGETYVHPEEKLELIKYGVPYTGYYNYIYKALYNTSKKIYGIIITATEVTDQVLARERIVEAEAILRGALELAELATWSIDIQKSTMMLSERFQQWMGYNNTTVTIEEGLSPVPDDYRQQVSDAINEAVKPGSKGIYQIEHPIVNKLNGQVRIITVQGQVFYDESGKPLVLRGTAQDITKQRRLQHELERLVQLRTEELAASNEELQSTNEELATTNEELAEANENLIHSNQELEQYAYVASHDLQEPLRKIRTFSDLLVKQELPDRSRKWIDKINQSAERMSLLIQSLLEFSRLLKSDKLMNTVDLNTVLLNVINDFELVIEEKHAVVNVKELPVIYGIELQMNQLFQNLLSNALKFSDKEVSPVITVACASITYEEARKHLGRAASYSSYYHITFADNGIGFEEKYAEHVFEIFKRLHSRDVYPGSGIGLALCKRIVTNHNGNIFVESVVGKGTTFHIILPDNLEQY